MALTVFVISLLFFLAHGLKRLFEVKKIPDLMILIIMGYLAGPVFGLVNSSDFGKIGPVLSAIALIVILFESGIQLNLPILMKSSLPASALSISGFLFTSLIGTGLTLMLTDMSLLTASLVGAALGGTSSSIVIPLAKNLSISENSKATLTLESAFTDVLAIVFFLFILNAITSNAQLTAGQALQSLATNFSLSLLMGVLSCCIWIFMRTHLAFFGKMKFAHEFWAFLTYGLIELLHFNGALGVLALGFFLGNDHLLPRFLSSGSFSREALSYEDQSLTQEIVFIVRTLFFLYLGTLIQFGGWSSILIALSFCFVIFLVRIFIVNIIFPKNSQSSLERTILYAMGPRGLACAVLATLPLQKGLADGTWIQEKLFATIPLTILITSLWVIIAEIKSKKSLKKKSSTNLSSETKNNFDNYLDDTAVTKEMALGRREMKELQQTSLKPEDFLENGLNRKKKSNNTNDNKK